MSRIALPFVLPFATALSLSLSACAPMPPADGPISGGSGPGEPEQQCNAAAARGAIGKVATAAVVEHARIDAGAQIVRTLKPGQMVTMEYHHSRLNIDVDVNNVVTNVRCG